MAGQTGGSEFVEVMQKVSLPVAIAAAACTLLGGCGLKGPLYLPEKTGEIVTRPAQAPPESGTAPNSPQTVDSPPSGETPATEVTAPPADATKEPDEDDKNPPPAPR
jgi:predicted small lipoprotein YifL